MRIFIVDDQPGLAGMLADGREPEEVICTHRAWVDGEEHSGKGELIEFKFAGEGLIHVPVSRILKILEQRMLKSPDDGTSWLLTFSPTQAAEVSSKLGGLPNLPGIEEFRTLRRGLFATLRGENGSFIVQASDLFPIRDQIVAYCELYLALLSHGLRDAEVAAPDKQQHAISELQKLLALDTVKVDLADYRGGHRTALLVGPTHPLRLLWLATWLTLARYWLERAKLAREYITSTRDSLLERLSLVNFPAVFPTSSGRLLTAVDNVHPLWTVYAASTEGDPRGLIAEICTALGLPEPNIGSFTLNGGFLADRIRRYLVQHPYIQSLVLNCFNAGRGKMLADTLLELQKEEDFRDLRYNIRLQ